MVILSDEPYAVGVKVNGKLLIIGTYSDESELADAYHSWYNLHEGADLDEPLALELVDRNNNKWEDITLSVLCDYNFSINNLDEMVA